MNGRISRRMLGVFKTRFKELQLEEVQDPRKARGKRWSKVLLLKCCLVGLASRCRSLAQVESLTEEMGPGLGRMLGLTRRVPDTTLRDLMVQFSPKELRACLHHQTKAAYRRKALKPIGLPFGVVAIDGKSVSIDAWDQPYVQRHRDTDHMKARGLLRTLTCSLVSSSSKICLDAIPIPGDTNEMGHFQKAFSELCRSYGRKIFGLASMDAGMCSLENADYVRSHKKQYLFALKQDQPTLRKEAERLLAHQDEPLAETVDVQGSREVRRVLYLTDEMAGYLNWRHLSTVLRVQSQETDLKTGEVTTESRYFISSVPSEELTREQWLMVVRAHWAVENHCHWTWDAVFEEDQRPWIRRDAQGALVVLLLRRIAYNMLSIFRSVTQRSAEARRTPWKDIMRWMYNAVINGQLEDIQSLRTRPTTAYG